MSPAATEQSNERLVQIPAGRRSLPGILTIPPAAEAVIVFADGGSEFTPRNRLIAQLFQMSNLATLLVNLLKPGEGEACEPGQEAQLVTQRLRAAADWLSRDPETAALQIGCFATGAGGEAALLAAAEAPFGAVVSWGGRPELVREHLPELQAATMMIVDGNDDPAVRCHEEALKLLPCSKALLAIPDASPLVTGLRVLPEVAFLAKEWFNLHLCYRC